MKYPLLKSCTMLSVFLMLVTFTGCGRSESTADPKNTHNKTRAVRVSVVKVEPVPIHDIMILPAETEAWEDVLAPAETDGRVEWIGPQEGDKVKKGQLLAKIDVSALKAALARAEAAFKLAEDLYQRRKRLFGQRIIDQEELDRSLTERNLARANLHQAQIEHRRGFLLAPITGMVNHLFVDEGEFIDRGKPLVALVNVDRIKININVPEMNVRYLRPRQEAMVTIDAYPGRQLSGAVDFVAFKADPATKTFLVRVLIDNPNHEIRPGMIARVSLQLRVIPDALVAPLFALVDKSGERILFVEKDGVAYSRTVSIGIIEGNRIQITRGLNAGDHLIVMGQTEVEDGTRVQVQ